MNGLNNELGDNALNATQSKQMADLYATKPEIAFDIMDLFRSPGLVECYLPGDCGPKRQSFARGREFPVAATIGGM